MKLIKGKNANRGFTLTELIVVMGLSIVVLTLMVTMLTIFTGKVNQNKAYHGFYDEVAMCRDEIQKALTNNDCGKTIQVESNTGNGSILVRKDTNKELIKLYGKELTVTYPSTKKIYFKYIDRIEFTIFEVAGTHSANQKILKCTFIGSYGEDDTAKGTHKTEFSQSMLFILVSDGAIFEYKN